MLFILQLTDLADSVRKVKTITRINNTNWISVMLMTQNSICFIQSYMEKMVISVSPIKKVLWNRTHSFIPHDNICDYVHHHHHTHVIKWAYREVLPSSTDLVLARWRIQGSKYYYSCFLLALLGASVLLFIDAQSYDAPIFQGLQLHFLGFYELLVPATNYEDSSISLSPHIFMWIS